MNQFYGNVASQFRIPMTYNGACGGLRAGQFRLPIFGQVSNRTTIITNNNYYGGYSGGYSMGGYGYGYGYGCGCGMPNWMMWMSAMPMLGQMFTGLFGLFGHKAQQPQQAQQGQYSPQGAQYSQQQPGGNNEVKEDLGAKAKQNIGDLGNEIGYIIDNGQIIYVNKKDEILRGPNTTDALPKGSQPPPAAAVVPSTDPKPAGTTNNNDGGKGGVYGYGLEEVPGQATTNGYKIKSGDYPEAIILGKYGISKNDPAFAEIQKQVYAASNYKPNTNISVDAYFTLPDVEFNGHTYKPYQPDANVKAGDVKKNGLGFSTLKQYEVQQTAGGYYVVDTTSNPAKRVDNTLYADENSAKAKVKELSDAAVAAGKKPIENANG